MARILTPTQLDNVNATATRPVRLVRWEHSGELELLSGSGEITFDGEVYTPGGFTTVTVEDGRSAIITLPATQDRVQEMIAGNWRNGKICQVYCVPGLPDDDRAYTAAEGLLELDGVIDASQYSNGVLTVSAVHRYQRGNITPRTTFNDFSTRIPAPGTLVTVYDSSSPRKPKSYPLTSRR